MRVANRIRRAGRRNRPGETPTALRPDPYTYAPTWSGIVYVAFVTDVFSRRLAGWKAARTMTATLVLDALNMAAWTRRHRHWPVSCDTPMRGRKIRPSPPPSD
jgi:transposase InsO family protein